MTNYEKLLKRSFLKYIFGLQEGKSPRCYKIWSTQFAYTRVIKLEGYSIVLYDNFLTIKYLLFYLFFIIVFYHEKYLNMIAFVFRPDITSL